jgi:hypothetical protein
MNDASWELQLIMILLDLSIYNFLLLIIYLLNLFEFNIWIIKIWI